MRFLLLSTAVALVASSSSLAAPLARTGDIPDNQVFVTFVSHTAGWSIKYPEGWARRGKGTRVTFRDKDNAVSVIVRRGATPTLAAIRRDTAKLHPSTGPVWVRVSGAPGVKLTYASVSAADAVTGKRIALVVDRYYLWRGGRVAVIELATPRGVDNVDAYRLMSESFRWR